MSSQNGSFGEIERMAMAAIAAIDLDTPAQQLHTALEAMLDVPTIARQEGTTLSRQATAALAKLRQDMQRLHEAVQMLETHIERPPAACHSSFQGRCALDADAVSPVGCAPLS